jgi:hypothetical protein
VVDPVRIAAGEVLQILGDAGRGKTTHLLAWHLITPGSVYEYLPEGSDRFTTRPLSASFSSTKPSGCPGGSLLDCSTGCPAWCSPRTPVCRVSSVARCDRSCCWDRCSAIGPRRLPPDPGCPTRSGPRSHAPDGVSRLVFYAGVIPTTRHLLWPDLRNRAAKRKRGDIRLTVEPEIEAQERKGARRVRRRRAVAVLRIANARRGSRFPWRRMVQAQCPLTQVCAP